MNAKQAKELDFRVLLERMGYYPEQGGIKKGGREIWYKSPLNHNDKTASFHISKGSQIAWVFKCFSTGKGGNILKFVIAHEGYAEGDTKSALAFLREKFPGSLFEYQRREQKPKANPQTSFSFHQQAGSCSGAGIQTLAADKELEYLEDLPLRSGTLISYLEKSRNIPARIAQKYLRLVRYKNLRNQKSYYAIGMKNRAGGFEIRAGSDSYSFKSALIARDLSVFNPNGVSNIVLVFEGMLDFLSYLVMSNLNEPPCDTVVMHSVNSFGRAVDYIRETGYETICTFLDNDLTGEKYTARFKTEFGGMAVSLSCQFHPHKDVNEALQQGGKLKSFDPPFQQPGLSVS